MEKYNGQMPRESPYVLPFTEFYIQLTDYSS